MKNLVLLLIVSLAWTSVEATDRGLYRPTDKKPLVRYVAPAALITTGIVANLPQFKNSVMSVTPRTHTKADDYLQYVPIVATYAFNAFGIQSKNSIWDKTKLLSLSLLGTAVITHTIKHTAREQRPNNGAFNSFPSGHTALAFTGAGVLYHEFKDSNKLVAYSGFGFAAAVGILRQTNRAHWVSDVLTGAGVGILTSTLIYHFQPLSSWQPFADDLRALSIHPTVLNCFNSKGVLGLRIAATI